MIGSSKNSTENYPVNRPLVARGYHLAYTSPNLLQKKTVVPGADYLVWLAEAVVNNSVLEGESSCFIFFFQLLRYL